MNGIEENVPPPQPAPRRLSSQNSTAPETNGVRSSSETIDEKGEVSLFFLSFKTFVCKI